MDSYISDNDANDEEDYETKRARITKKVLETGVSPDFYGSQLFQTYYEAISTLLSEVLVDELHKIKNKDK